MSYKLKPFLLFMMLIIFASVDAFASGEGGHEEAYDPVSSVLHHISDANEFHFVKGVSIPLPCIVYAPGEGWSFFSSAVFEHGHKAYNGYVLNHGRVNRIADGNFPKGKVDIEGIEHKEVKDEKTGEEREVSYAIVDGKEYVLDPPSTLDGGLVGGGVTSFYDFSLTRNVAMMILAVLLLFWLFSTVARAYKRREGKPPRGVQSLMEPLFVFMRDEVAKPMIGPKYEKYLPFIMSLFFFVLILNLLGLFPPFGANITGNISVTLALAVLTFLVVNLSGNKNYWRHVFWMPGIPAWVKIILTPVEILSLFIKPFALTIRLLANISAGHIIILSIVGLIFLLGHSGQSIGGAIGGGVIGMLLGLLMNLLEILVAFVQAYIFAMLSASYIGAAIEEHH